MKKMFISGRFFFLVLLTMTVSYAGEHVFKESGRVVIASDGKALFPLVISKDAPDEVRYFAKDLTGILRRMSGADFKVEEGNGLSGIAVGTASDFPEIPLKVSFDVNHPGESQGYEIKSHNKGVYIIGATPQAVGYAVYDFLQRLGYRKFFPMDKWEIIPEKQQLELAVHIRETPDYYTRRIWPGYGLWPEYRESSAKLNAVNRNSGYLLSTGHAYERIINENKKIFDQHPEYYGLLKGKRSSNKLCISNPDLRKLVVDFALSIFERNPELKSFSAEPSDGGGWCECEECGKLGTPSTRAVFLSNTVAEAVRQRFSGKRIGMYAYNLHSEPPAIDVDRDVVVSIATVFIKGGLLFDEIVEGWRRKNAAIGIREYYGVYIWSLNLPGKSHGSDLNYLKTTIPRFYNMGARYMIAEASDDWGANGLGYFLADKMLWNIKNSENIDALVQDFLDTSFGPASSEMKEFYNLLDGSTTKPLCSDLLGRMYRQLQMAMEKVSEKPTIMKRICDLVLYTRYCEMYMVFNQASKDQKQKSFDRLMEFTASIRDTRMVHSFAVFREYKRIFRGGRETPAGDLTRYGQFTLEQINKIISEGIAANELLDFEVVNFSNNLVSAQKLYKELFKDSQIQPRRGTVTYYTWADEKLQPWDLSVTGGLIEHFRNRGNVRIELWKIGGDSDTGELETLIQGDASVPPDGTARIVKLTPKQTGLHKIVISDGGDMTRVEWEHGRNMTILADTLNPLALSGDFCFYVPKGTKTLGFFCDMKRGQIISPDRKTAFKFSTTLGYNSIPINEGMDGRIWRLQNISGCIGLMTVPPYLAIEPAGLLLPEEIVKKDKL